MIVGVIHKCCGCSSKGESLPDDLPRDWSEARLFQKSLALCPRCTKKAEEPVFQESLLTVLIKHLEVMAVVGDMVTLLVDGCRGKFKGREGVVKAVDGRNSYTIRVPGAVAPGETSEYCGPYGRDQFEVIQPGSEARE